jgi:hypothetical protein
MSIHFYCSVWCQFILLASFDVGPGVHGIDKELGTPKLWVGHEMWLDENEGTCMAQWVTGIEPSKFADCAIGWFHRPFLGWLTPWHRRVKHAQMASPAHLYPGWFWWCHNSHWDKRMATGTSGYMEFVHGHGHYMRLRCATSDRWAAVGIVRRILIAFWKVFIFCALCHPAVGNWRNEMYAQIERQM